MPKLPGALLRVAAEAMSECDDLEDEHAPLSFIVGVRLLQARCDHDLCKDGRAPLLDIEVELPMDDKDPFLRSPEWFQIQPGVMSQLVFAVLAKHTDDPDVDFAGHLARWAQSGSAGADKALVRLTQLHTQDATARMEAMLKKAMHVSFVSSQIACATLNAVCSDRANKPVIDNDYIEEGPANKRRKTAQSEGSESEWTSVLPGLETEAKELLTEAALQWSVDNFEQFSKSEPWLQLNSAALVRTATAAFKKQNEEPSASFSSSGDPSEEAEIIESDGEVQETPKTLRALSVARLKERLRIKGLPCSGPKADLVDRLASSIRKGKEAKPVKTQSEVVEKQPKSIPNIGAAVKVWAAAVDVQSVFDALEMVSAASGEAVCPLTFNALLIELRHRMSAAEQRLAAFREGKFQQELESAVMAARQETESRMCRQQEDAEAALRHQLESEQRQELLKLKRGIVALFEDKNPLGAAVESGA